MRRLNPEWYGKRVAVTRECIRCGENYMSYPFSDEEQWFGIGICKKCRDTEYWGP